MRTVEAPKLSTRTATEEQWRVVAACVAAQMVSVSDEDARELARLWTLIHPEGAV